MGDTRFGLNDSMAVKTWEKMVAVAERQYTDIAPLMGEDDNSIIQVKSQLKNGPGDRVTFALRARLLGNGVTSTQVAEGNGEALSFYSDAVVIDELGHVVGVRSKNTIDQQRVPFDLRVQARDGLTQWWGDRRSVSFFNQVCGYTAATDVRFTGLQGVTAPSANRRIFGGAAGAVSADESLNSSHPFTLDLVDRAVELAQIGDVEQRVRPLRIGGEDKYVCYLHPKQVTSLRTNTSTGQWLDIQKAALAGGIGSKSPIYTNALGEYNGVIFRRGLDVTPGVNSTTGASISGVRRAVLLGAQASIMAYGKAGYDGNRFRWNEELFDHKRKLEVSAWNIWGMKKVVFNSQDFGTIVISTFVN